MCKTKSPFYRHGNCLPYSIFNNTCIQILHRVKPYTSKTAMKKHEIALRTIFVHKTFSQYYTKHLFHVLYNIGKMFWNGYLTKVRKSEKAHIKFSEVMAFEILRRQCKAHNYVKW